LFNVTALIHALAIFVNVLGAGNNGTLCIDNIASYVTFKAYSMEKPIILTEEKNATGGIKPRHIFKYYEVPELQPRMERRRPLQRREDIQTDYKSGRTGEDAGWQNRQR
jgi:hypothetical protein